MHTSQVHFRQKRQQPWECFLGNITICLPTCVQDLLDFWFARMKQEMVSKLGVGWANISHFQMPPDTCHLWLGFLNGSSTLRLLNKTSMLGKLLRPSKAKYEQQTGTPIPDSVLVATLMNKTSGALQQHLRLNAATINTYEQMRNTLVQYFRSRHILTSSDSGLAPMDIGALKGKGYFKGKSEGKGKGLRHWNFMKGKGGKSKGKGKGKNFKGMKGRGKGKTSNKGKGKGVVCYTCGKPGHISRECNLNRVNAVNETPWTDTSWNDDWPEYDTSNVVDAQNYENDETSWPDEWYVGNVDFDDWWYDDRDWTSWEDDWSWDHTWDSSWNEPTSSSHPTLQESQNKTSVTVTELPSSSTSGSGAKVSAVTSGPPPGLDRTSRIQGNSSRSKSLLMAAITLGSWQFCTCWTSCDFRFQELFQCGFNLSNPREWNGSLRDFGNCWFESCQTSWLWRCFHWSTLDSSPNSWYFMDPFWQWCSSQLLSQELCSRMATFAHHWS